MGNAFRLLFALALALAIPVQARAESLGRLSFPTSGSGQAQQAFLRGVAALHSFWFEEALDSFRAARASDPDFVMAHWGEAMAHNHPLWAQQDLQAAREVLKELGRTRSERLARAPTERERRYLDAVETLYGGGDKHDRDLRYAQAMGKLSEDYPDDREAAAFHALALLGTVQRGDSGFRREMQAAAILEPIFDANPDHPGAAHYLIHSYDDPDHAPLGLPAAQRYADIAPEAHHALHMPTHIFVQLGMWEGVARSNRRAYDASDAWVKRAGLPLSKRDFHSLSWLQYAQLQLGRFADAHDTVEEMKRSARETGDPRSLRSVDSMIARQVIETRDWAAATALERDVEDSQDRVDALNALGFAAAHGGEPERALQIADRLAALRESQEGSGQSYRASRVGIIEQQVRAVAELAAGRPEAGLELARDAAEREARMDPPSGPPSPIKPAHELLAELLLETERAEEAEVAFRAALERIPGRAPARLGLARSLARQDRPEQAAEIYAELLESWREADAELPVFSELRSGAGADGRD